MLLWTKLKETIFQNLENDLELQQKINTLFNQIPLPEDKVLLVASELINPKIFSNLFADHLQSIADLPILHTYISILVSKNQRDEAILILETLSQIPNFISLTFLRRLLFMIKMPEADKEELKKLFCHIPFDTFMIWPNGNIMSCCRLPEIGNINQDSFENIWNSKLAQEIRQSIIDGNFQFCNLYDCDLYRRKTLPLRENINLNDYLSTTPKEGHWGGAISCSQACYWCRPSTIIDKNENHLWAREEEIYRYYRDCSTIHTSSSAEFSDSPFTLSLINKLGPRTPQGTTRLWRLAANGISFTPSIWEQIKGSCHKVRLSVSGRSLDSKVFASISPNSSLETWYANMRFYLKMKEEGFFSFIRLKIVVSTINYKEIPAFIDWAQQNKVDEILFRRIHQWGALSQEKMKVLDICHPSHPKHNELLSIIDSTPHSANVIFRDLA